MNKFKGTATDVQHTMQTDEYETTSTNKYTATFFINNTEVIIEQDKPIHIEENDVVIVAGDHEGSVLKANAYKNITSGVSTEHDGSIKIGIGIFMIGASIYMLHDINYAFEKMSFTGIALVSFLILGGFIWIMVGWSMNSSLKDLEDDIPESVDNNKTDHENQKLS